MLTPAVHAPVQHSYADAIQKAAPSVVNIYTTKKLPQTHQQLPDVPSLRAFILEQHQSAAPTDLGSGVIADPLGHILTNYHVVEAADMIEVSLHDGRKFTATLLGSDPETDLAVLKIDAPNLAPVDVETDLTLRIGDIVLAIGNPFDVGQTTTFGIVSALGRSGLGISTLENFIQTDAAINPGNSGGALVNTQGRLVGINTAIYGEEESVGSLGIGFAIPAHTALSVMHDIVQYGKVNRAWLGADFQIVTRAIAKTFHLKDAQGVIIRKITPNSPAAKARLQVGDIILEVNGQPIQGVGPINQLISRMRPGTTVAFSLLRGNQRLTHHVLLETQP